MQLGLDEDDAVEELLDDLVLGALVRRADLGLPPQRVLVDGGLHGLCVTGVLKVRNCVRQRRAARSQSGKWDAARGCVVTGRTESSNALNSCSLDFLYCSISFSASDRASFSFWTRSVRTRCQ